MNILGLSSRYNDIIAEGNVRLDDESLKIGTKTDNDLSFIVNNTEQLTLTSSGANIQIDEIQGGTDGKIEICGAELEGCGTIEGEWIQIPNPSVTTEVLPDGKPRVNLSAPITDFVMLDNSFTNADEINISFRVEKSVTGQFDEVGIGYYGNTPPLVFNDLKTAFLAFYGVKAQTPFSDQSNSGNGSTILNPRKLQSPAGPWNFVNPGVYRIRFTLLDGKASWYVKPPDKREYKVSTCDISDPIFTGNWLPYVYNSSTGNITSNAHISKDTEDVVIDGWDIHETFSHLNELANNETVEQLPKVLKVIDQETNDWKLNRKEYEYTLPERSGRLITVDDIGVNDINTELLTLEVAENTTRISQNESDIKDLQGDVIANSNDITSINLALNDKVNKGGEDTGSLIIGTTALNVNDVQIIQNGNPGITIDGVNITTSKNLRNAVNGDYAFQSSITSLEGSKVSRGGEPLGTGILTVGTADSSQVQVAQNGVPALTVDSANITTNRTLTNLIQGDYAFDSAVQTNSGNITTNAADIATNAVEIKVNETGIFNNTSDILNLQDQITSSGAEITSKLSGEYSSLLGSSNMQPIDFSQSQFVSGGISYNPATNLISSRSNTQTKSIWTSTPIVDNLSEFNYILEFELAGASESNTTVAFRSNVDDDSKALWVTQLDTVTSFPQISGVQATLATSQGTLFQIIMDNGKVITLSSLQNKGNELRYIRFVIVSGMVYVLGKDSEEWFNWSLDPGVILGAGSPQELSPGYRIDTSKSYYVGVFDNTNTDSSLGVIPRIYSVSNQVGLGMIVPRLNGRYEDLKQNPRELTGINASYPVQWSTVKSGDITVSTTTSVVSKGANTQVSWIYSKKGMLEPHKYNYRVKVSIYSVVASQVYVHFCSKNIPATDRTGTTYPAESGTTGTFPVPNITNIWGAGAAFRLSTAFYQYISESQIINFPNTGDNITTTGATQAVPWEFTFVIHDGKITGILVEHGTDPVFDAISRFGVSEFDLPGEPLFIGLSDVNNFTPASSFEIGVSILQRSVRPDAASPYTLKNLITSEFISDTLSSEAERFIPARANIARLNSYVSGGSIVSDTYYLPYPVKIGQRLLLFNESLNTLTVYYPDNSSSITLQGNILDHAEFVALDLLTWRQLA